jgi:hypothetical protein
MLPTEGGRSASTDSTRTIFYPAATRSASTESARTIFYPEGSSIAGGGHMRRLGKFAQMESARFRSRQSELGELARDIGATLAAARLVRDARTGYQAGLSTTLVKPSPGAVASFSAERERSPRGRPALPPGPIAATEPKTSKSARNVRIVVEAQDAAGEPVSLPDAQKTAPRTRGKFSARTRGASSSAAVV